MDDESRNILTARLLEWSKHYGAKAEAAGREHKAAQPYRKSSEEILEEAARKHSPAWREWEAKRKKALAANARHVQAQNEASPIGRFVRRLLTRRAQSHIDQAETQLAWLRRSFQENPNYYSPDQAREVDAVQRAASDLRSTNEGALASWHETYQYWPYAPSQAHSLHGHAHWLQKAAELTASGSDFLRLDEIPDFPALADPSAAKTEEVMSEFLHHFNLRVMDAETKWRLAQNTKSKPELSPNQKRAIELREKLLADKQDPTDPLEKLQRDSAKPKSARGADGNSDPLDRIREREFDQGKKKKPEQNRYLGPER